LKIKDRPQRTKRKQAEKDELEEWKTKALRFLRSSSSSRQRSPDRQSGDDGFFGTKPTFIDSKGDLGLGFEDRTHLSQFSVLSISSQQRERPSLPLALVTEG